jgi:hypothetical protein
MESENNGGWYSRLTTTGWYTILIDQINNLLHYRVLLVVSKRDLCDEAPDLSVKFGAWASLGVVLHGGLNARH